MSAEKKGTENERLLAERDLNKSKFYKAPNYMSASGTQRTLLFIVVISNSTLDPPICSVSDNE